MTLFYPAKVFVDISHSVGNGKSSNGNERSTDLTESIYCLSREVFDLYTTAIYSLDYKSQSEQNIERNLFLI